MTKRKAANLANGANGNPMISAHSKGNELNREIHECISAITFRDMWDERRKYEDLYVWPEKGMHVLTRFANEYPGSLQTLTILGRPKDWKGDTIRAATYFGVDCVHLITDVFAHVLDLKVSQNICGWPFKVYQT